MTTPHDLDLQEAARRHLWLHFTRMSSYASGEVPVIVRGSGQYVYDQHGKRYLDGLAGLFVSQIGHGRREVAEAGARPVMPGPSTQDLLVWALLDSAFLSPTGRQWAQSPPEGS